MRLLGFSGDNRYDAQNLLPGRKTPVKIGEIQSKPQEPKDEIPEEVPLEVPPEVEAVPAEEQVGLKPKHHAW